MNYHSGRCCCFTSQVNSYGHGGTVSSPNHTFFLGKLEQAVNQYFVHILTPILLEGFIGREENDRRNYLMINLHESMGPDRDRCTLDLQSDSYLLPDTLPTTKKIGHKTLSIFLSTSLNIVLGSLIKTVPLSIHNKCFG